MCGSDSLQLGYEAMLLPGEELMFKIQGVYDISQHVNAIGTLYITSFQSFFVDEARGKVCVHCIKFESSIKYYTA